MKIREISYPHNSGRSVRTWKNPKSHQNHCQQNNGGYRDSLSTNEFRQVFSEKWYAKVSLCLTQQKKRKESILDCIRTVAKTEETSLMTIVSLAMQLLTNDVDNREIASFAKTMVFDGNFGREVVKSVPIDKSVFLIDLLKIERRKYTHLLQLLLPNGIKLSAYNKVVDFRDTLIYDLAFTFIRTHRIQSECVLLICSL